ncbi:FMN-dependent oxidoreductase (nitrilotriacetate monooxygenase family) [Paraburkholderia sp. JPY465]|uniref:LLM class flavin-dependent oxidoreductase n=1 Tax=Paraburkholderia sp. JPY465 TaxID=3042285 RepID=UPI003D224134
MKYPRRKLALGLFLHAAGYHTAGWRHPAARSDTEDIGYLVDLCQRAEQGKFHFAFVADGLSTGRHASPSVVARLEPLTLLSAVALRTTHIGLVATVSTTYSEPYTVARQLASLDHISRGRAGWNIVTSSSESAALNYGTVRLPDPAQRYSRGEEFVDVVCGLWDSWEDGAFVRDKTSGKYFEPDKLHSLDHRGEHFDVAGPLNVSRCPQGRPILIQAGSSGPGKRLAARVADVVFTAQPEADEARRFAASLKEQAATGFGRTGRVPIVMPGIVPFVGRTREEAFALYESLQEKIDAGRAYAALSERFGQDVSHLALDAPVPDELLQSHLSSRVTLLKSLADRKGLTMLGLYRIMAGTNGHFPVIGTPSDIADHIQSWWQTGAADGFNVMPPYFPGGLQDFIDSVVPLLQERGIYHEDYDPLGLRADLGLDVPANRHTAQRITEAEHGSSI